ncbi:hypothetical protein EDC04DRAFT_2038665 [Pisolithus marmoratus]|nr:hypothetical protein EDC04DRAFT_2038665 [Pisolithus marmoratus]
MRNASVNTECLSAIPLLCALFDTVFFVSLLIARGDVSFFLHLPCQTSDYRRPCYLAQLAAVPTQGILQGVLYWSVFYWLVYFYMKGTCRRIVSTEVCRRMYLKTDGALLEKGLYYRCQYSNHEFRYFERRQRKCTSLRCLSMFFRLTFFFTCDVHQRQCTLTSAALSLIAWTTAKWSAQLAYVIGAPHGLPSSFIQPQRARTFLSQSRRTADGLTRLRDWFLVI